MRQDVSVNQNAENVLVGIYVPHPFDLSFFRMAKKKKAATLTDWSHSTRSSCARFLQRMLYCSGRVLRSHNLVEGDHVQDGHDDTVLHRDLEDDLSSFSLFQCTSCWCLSSQCCCLLLDWVARPCIGLAINAFLQELLRNSSFPFL